MSGALGDGGGEPGVGGLGGAPDGRLPDEDQEDEGAAHHVHDAQHAKDRLKWRGSSIRDDFSSPPNRLPAMGTDDMQW